MATILVTHGIPAEGFSLLSGEKIVIPKPLMQFSTDELAALIPAADAVVACGALPGEIIRRGRKLRIIAGYGAGYDGVDVRAAAECGIPVTNLPDTVTDSTAELAIGLMLAVSRRIGENSLRAREEAPENLFGMGRSMGRSLRGQMLGLLGCGRIGKRTAEIAAAFGMRCIGYSRHGVNHPQVESVPLPELLAQSTRQFDHADPTASAAPLAGLRGAILGAAALPGGIALPQTAGAWSSFLYMTVVAGLGALMAQTWAQSRLDTTTAAIIMTTEPVFAAGFAIAFGGEALTTRLLLGGALVLAAMFLVETKEPETCCPEGSEPASL